MSFMTCDATRNASLELRVAGQRIGGLQHFNFMPKSANSFEEVVRVVQLPMFKDAIAAADAAAGEFTIVVTTTGCDDSQKMRTTLELKQLGVLKCQ